MEQTERQLELQKQKRLQRVDSMPEDTIDPVIVTPERSRVVSGTPPKSLVEFLEGDELQQAIDGNCEEVDGKVTLILRASGEEEKKLAFRIPKVAFLLEDFPMISRMLALKSSSTFCHFMDMPIAR